MLRRTALLVIAFTLLVGAATTVASTGAQTLDVYYRDIKLVVNGAKVATPAEPFIHDGTTYVPPQRRVAFAAADHGAGGLSRGLRVC